ncbi:MAG: glycosyltransferase family 4 protein [Candidatus Saccharimonadales bacterium]
MKVGLICPYNVFRGGGVQEYVLGIRDGLTAAGHQAWVITPQPRGYKGPKIPGIIMLGGSAPIRAFHTYAQVSASVDIDKLDEALRTYKFDILHFHEPWVPMLSRQILGKSDAINIGTFHAAMSERRTSRTLERVITPYTKPLLKRLDILTAVSPVATNYVKSLTTRKIYIIPNGINLKKYKPENPHEPEGSSKTIFYIGRLEKRKAVDQLLKAFSIIQKFDNRYHLKIAGDGPQKTELEELSKDLKLKNIEFLGQIDEADKIKLLQTSDVFCSPALYGESFGIVLLEAMAAGCVIVAGANAGYESVLSGTGQLSLANPKDSKEFARKLMIMATNQAIRKVWLEWAESEATHYSYDNIVKKYLMLYKLAYDKRHNS